ncbi:MAG: hypothetical protein AB1420_03215 [Bacillota bacterium]
MVGNAENAKVLLNAYVKKGLVKRVRRDLYCAVNLENRDAPKNRYVIGSKINESAYLTHHSAFEVHGLSHQLSFVVYVASESKISDFTFEGVSYKYVGKGIEEGVTHYRLNEKVRVTDLERTVVDSLDRPDYCGLKYLEAYDKNVLYKKAGYFLERHQQTLKISDGLLQLLEKRTGRMKKYLSEEAKSGGGVFKKRWGLIVPRTFEERDELFV